jgi:hypothetical protein
MAAGLGFKNFASGDVLTAADVNAYLNSQTVMVFADAAARTAAITSPQEGMFSYLKDTNATQYYTGSAWTNLDTTGMVNPMTTTGDTIYSSSGTTPARLGIGTAGQVLTVNSGATAPEWATASSGGMTLLASGTLSGASLALTSISSSYQDLRLVVRNLLPATDGTAIRLRFNNDSTANRYQWNSVASNALFDKDHIEIQSYSTSNSSSQGINMINVYDYANTTTWKYCDSRNFNNRAGTPANVNIDAIYKGIYNQTGAISQLNLFMSSGNFTSGNYYLYGIK